MKELIKYFNDNYGLQYGNIDYPRTKKQIYSTYQIIKEFGVKDDKLDKLLKEINLPTPKTIEEKDLYSECINNVSNVDELDNSKYILIKNDNSLIINKKDITDNTNSSISVSNLNGLYGTLTDNTDETYTYTLNTIMRGMEVFTFIIDGVEQKVIITPYKEMLYNDSNSGITYTGTWETGNDTNHFDGSSHYSNVSQSKLNFNFTGTGVDVYTKIDATAGRVMARLSGGNLTANKYLIVDNKANGNNVDYKVPTVSYRNLEYGTYEVEITVLNPIVENGVSRGAYYLDGIRVYNTIVDLDDETIKSFYKEDVKNSSNYLKTDGVNRVYTPTSLYDPATKKYVDDSMSKIDIPQVDLSNYSTVDHTHEEYVTNEELSQQMQSIVQRLIALEAGTVVTPDPPTPTETIVGTVGADNTITLTNLENGSYTLRYEDNDGVITGYDDIATMEVV